MNWMRLGQKMVSARGPLFKPARKRAHHTENKPSRCLAKLALHKLCTARLPREEYGRFAASSSHRLLSTPFGSASATAEPAEPVSLADGNSLRETSRKARTSVSTPGTELPVVAVRHRLPHTTAVNRLEQTATTAPKGRKKARMLFTALGSEVTARVQKP